MSEMINGYVVMKDKPMYEKIIIGRPYLKDVGEKVRLCADVSGYREIILYYEVDKEYEDYLDSITSDAFMVMLIEYCQLHGLDMEFEGTITDRLLDYVNEYFVPLLSENIGGYHKISITSDVTRPISVGTMVGTGFSAGVDSFYTVYKQLRTTISRNTLTHVLFVNVGAQTYDFDESCRIFKGKTEKLKRVVEEVNKDIKFVEVNSNCLELYSDLIGKGFTGPDARKTCSCVIALKKLFSTYYFSNGPTLDRFSFSSKDPAHYDLFTINMLEKTGITFYSRGIETPKRIDKLRYIVDEVSVKNNLSVCIDKNCGVCEKCVRTELELYALGKLEEYQRVFNVPDFKKNIVRYTAKYLAITEEHKLGFVKEIEEEAKKNGVYIPVSAYILSAFFYHPMYVAKFIIKKQIRKIKRVFSETIDAKCITSSTK